VCGPWTSFRKTITSPLRRNPVRVCTCTLHIVHFVVWLQKANNYPTRCNYIQFIYIRKLLNTFRVVTPPIIRSSCHCITASGIIKTIIATFRERDWTGALSWMLLDGNSSSCPVTFTKVCSYGLNNARSCDTVTGAPDDGWRHHPKYVEQFTDINKYICIFWDSYWHIFTMHGPLNVKKQQKNWFSLIFIRHVTVKPKADAALKKNSKA
jgi:hypothetical protein